MLTGITFQSIDDSGLHITSDGKTKTLDVDNVVVCSGQLSENKLAEELRSINKHVHVIGGACQTKGLDAEAAIRQGAELAVTL
jgi:2,4-dienoyl-CoA reductase (NADPH2)